MPKPAKSLPSRRCSAISKQRKRNNPEQTREELRCKKPAAAGALVCEIHGGKAPQVIAAARQRLLDAADPASTVLLELLTEAEDDSVRLRAATAILDRSGHGPTTKQVNVDGGAVKYQIEGVDMEAL